MTNTSGHTITYMQFTSNSDTGNTDYMVWAGTSQPNTIKTKCSCIKVVTVSIGYDAPLDVRLEIYIWLLNL